MRPRILLAALSIIVLALALPSDSSSYAAHAQAPSTAISETSTRPAALVSTIRNLSQLKPGTTAPWWGMPVYPAGCGILEGEVWCIGWRIGPEQQYASRWRAKSPVHVPLPGKAVALAIGYGPMCAVISTRTQGYWQRKGNDPAEIWCWGEGFDSTQQGAMANMRFATTSSPVLLYSSRDIDAISAGYGYVCILENDVTLRCWGNIPNIGQQTTGIDLFSDSSLRGVQARRDGAYVLRKDTNTWSAS